MKHTTGDVGLAVTTVSIVLFLITLLAALVQISRAHVKALTPQQQMLQDCTRHNRVTVDGLVYVCNIVPDFHQA